MVKSEPEISDVHLIVSYFFISVQCSSAVEWFHNATAIARPQRGMPRPPPPGRAKTRVPGFTARCDGSMVPQKAPHESLEFLNVSDLQTKPPRMSEKKMSCSHISPSCCHCWIGHVLDSIEVTSWQYRPSEQSYILLFTHSVRASWWLLSIQLAACQQDSWNRECNLAVRNSAPSRLSSFETWWFGCWKQVRFRFPVLAAVIVLYVWILMIGIQKYVLYMYEHFTVWYIFTYTYVYIYTFYCSEYLHNLYHSIWWTSNALTLGERISGRCKSCVSAVTLSAARCLVDRTMPTSYAHDYTFSLSCDMHPCSVARTPQLVFTYLQFFKRTNSLSRS